MLCKVRLTLVAFLLSAWLAGADDALPKGQRVFVAGHSFHIFVSAGLKDLAKSAKISDHEAVGQQMIGGSRVLQHWNKPDKENKAKAALQTGNVDVLTLSPNWVVPDEGIDLFVELALKHNQKTRTFVQISWFPWDGLKKEDKVAKNEDRDKKTVSELRPIYETFNKTIEQQVREINEKYKRPVAFIVPVGDAVLSLREKVIAGKVPGVKKQSDLFTDQIGHAGAAVRSLAVYCHYAAIYRQKPTAIPSNAKAEEHELHRLLQEIAWEKVSKHPLGGIAKK